MLPLPEALPVLGDTPPLSELPPPLLPEVVPVLLPVEGVSVDPLEPVVVSVLPLLVDWAKLAVAKAVDAIKATKTVLVFIVVLLIAGMRAVQPPAAAWPLHAR